MKRQQTAINRYDSHCRSIDRKQTIENKRSIYPSLQLLPSHFTVLGISYFEVLYQKVR
jgi:hypothetical protein